MPVLEAILLFVLMVVGAIAPGVDDAPGLAALTDLPAVVGERANAVLALQESGRPESLPASVNAAVANGAPETVPPADEAAVESAPPVDVSNAPESIDLSGVPAADEANVPNVVGAVEAAGPPSEVPAGPPSDVPAGPPSDVPADPPSAVPASDNASETAGCAANARGQGAAGCQTGE